MILKLAKKKEINEDVLRMIIQYGLGFASRVKNLENKEIEDWKEDKLYEKGAKVLYNNSLWVAKVTNQSSAWNESYWEKVGDDLELIDLDTIKTMLGLTTDELQTLSSIILDSQVRLDKTYSSSKIYTDLQQCLNDSKAFTLQEFAKASKASYQVVSATSQMLDKSVIYLMPNSTNYDMYIVESDGTPTKIGDTTIDLSQFYTKTEIDNDFVKKTDADGKYALITTVDGKVDKTSILSTISSTPSDDKLLSEKAIKNELDTINTNLDDKVNKASITTTIGSTSTDSELPTAKTVYSNVKYASGYTDTIVIDCNECIKVGYYFADRNTTNNPTSETYGILHVFGYKTDIESKNTQWIFQEFTSASGKKYMRYSLNPNSLTPTNWTSWESVCTTSVVDVGVKTINPTFPSTVTLGSSQRIIYSIKNGWANVSTVMQFSSPKLSWTVIATGLPKPDKTVNTSTLGETFVNANVAYRIKTDGTLEMRIDSEITQLNWWNINVSYPVAES